MDTDYASTGLVFYLFAIFCAYWAQITNRKAWAWFVGGLLLAPFVGPYLLYKTAQDRSQE